MMNLCKPGKIWSTVNFEQANVSSFYYFVYLKVNLDLEETNKIGDIHPTLFP